ncbi:MAG: hypothetical protein HYV67_01890 [Candidatus Taylorbacteria bacterium]|nr:hypothetical protein [Candidatus Taylorbacteria bacterium]
MDKKTLSTLALFALLSLSPASSSAQTYIKSIVSYSPTTYQYGAARLAVSQGPRTVVSARRPVAVAPQRAAVPLRAAQAASVASAFSSTPTATTPTPQLPKTGGGGRALVGPSQTNYNHGLFLVEAVSTLILGLLLLLVLRKPRQNEVSMKF